MLPWKHLWLQLVCNSMYTRRAWPATTLTPASLANCCSSFLGNSSKLRSRDAGESLLSSSIRLSAYVFDKKLESRIASKACQVCLAPCQSVLCSPLFTSIQHYIVCFRPNGLGLVYRMSVTTAAEFPVQIRQQIFDSCVVLDHLLQLCSTRKASTVTCRGSVAPPEHLQCSAACYSDAPCTDRLSAQSRLLQAVV